MINSDTPRQRGQLSKAALAATLLLASLSFAISACQTERVVEVPIEREVVREVEVPVAYEVEVPVVERVEVMVPVEVEKEVVRAVEVEVPVEIVREVVRTVEVEKQVEVIREVVVTVEVEKPVEIVVPEIIEFEKLVPIEIEKLVTVVVEKPVEGLLAASPRPSKSDPEAYAVWLVNDAIDRYVATGRDATLRYHNGRANVDGQWYVFIIGEDDRIVAHVDQTAIGQSLAGEIGTDLTGRRFGLELLAVGEEGGWFRYPFTNPETNAQAPKHTYAAKRDGLIFGTGYYDPTPTKDDPAAYTKQLVELALARYEADGRDATIEYYNRPEALDGQYYVYIVDENDDVVSHYNPDAIGQSTRGAIGIDDTGYRFGIELLAASEDGTWMRRRFVHPETGEFAIKHSYSVRRDGLLFGSGWYEDEPTKDEPEAYTEAFVNAALARLHGDGLEATVEYYNSTESIDGQWYIFIIDGDDKLVAHANPEAVGADVAKEIGTDRVGRRFGFDILQATETGTWGEYVFPNLAIGENAPKFTYAVRRGDIVVGSGWYDDVPVPGDDEKYAKWIVDAAIGKYLRDGLSDTLEFYNSPEAVNGEWYVFIIDEQDEIIAHADQSLIGESLFGPIGTDFTGRKYAYELAAVGADGGIVSYYLVNPATGMNAKKQSWAVRRNGLLFGAGWYEDVPTPHEPAAYAQRLVDEALARLHADGRDATIDYYNTPDAVDGEWYVFIIDENDNTIAHADQSILGESVLGGLGTGPDGDRFGLELMTAGPSGKWVDYIFNNPATGQDALKHTWVVKRDGLILGSGYYED